MVSSPSLLGLWAALLLRLPPRRDGETAATGSRAGDGSVGALPVAVARPGQAGPLPCPASKMYLAGKLGEWREAVAERRRILRALIFREYLLDVHSLVSRPRQ